MVKRDDVDAGRDIDWGRTSADYAKYRPGPPPSVYEILKIHGVGLPGQKVLDQGTGTGVFARQMARQGCEVTGTDLSATQAKMAEQLAKDEGLTNTTFMASPAEVNPFPDHSFDIMSASQCFSYFDKKVWIPEAKRLLKPGGKFVYVYFHWLPLEDPISGATEKLVLKHNPVWDAHSEQGIVPQFEDYAKGHFDQTGLFVYDEDISFTREVWRGRIRALRAIGATLSPEEVAAFDAEHEQMLAANFPDTFPIRHRVIIRVLTPLA